MDAFNQYFLDVIKNKYADFDGRARRQEYWMFLAFNLGTIVALWIVIAILGSIADFLGMIGGLAYMVYALGVLVPGVAVAVRRMHDTGRSGWMLLLGVIPFIGLIVIYFMVLEGDEGPNEYGPDPKDPYAEDLSGVLDTY